MKQDQTITKNDSKSQGVVSATPATPPFYQGNVNRKGEDKKKIKSGRLARSARQGK